MVADPNVAHFEWPVATGDPAREVWYSLVSPRDSSLAFWYRYTLLSTERGYQEGRLWAALTDRENPEESTFVTRAVGFDDIETGREPFSLSIGDGELTSSSARGSIEDVSWELSYEPDTFVFTPLRSQLLTDLLSRAIGTGKHWSRNESVFMSGEVTVGDRSIDLSNAPGHQGHTVSFSSPPEDWTWVQCNDFEENDSAVLEALRLDDKLSVCFRIDGEAYPLNRVHHIHPLSPRANSIEHDEVGNWRFSAAGEGIDLSVEVESPDHWQYVTYKVPDDSLRYNAHCSLSDVTVTYSRDGESPTTLTSSAGRAEWVSDRPPREGEYAPDWD